VCACARVYVCVCVSVRICTCVRARVYVHAYVRVYAVMLNIYYTTRVTGTCVSLFAIHSETGEMTIAGDIDRDSGGIMDSGGMCELNIMVTHTQEKSYINDTNVY